MGRRARAAGEGCGTHISSVFILFLFFSAELECFGRPRDSHKTVYTCGIVTCTHTQKRGNFMSIEFIPGYRWPLWCLSKKVGHAFLTQGKFSTVARYMGMKKL